MYDPVDDLAELVDGLRAMAASEDLDDMVTQLGVLAVGPYARLRSGLLLDEPGREGIPAAHAIREAIREAQERLHQLADYPVLMGVAAGPVPAEQGVFAYIPPAAGHYPVPARDLPVTSAATAAASYTKLVGHYQKIWPEDRTREVRKRLLELAGRLPRSERDKLPGWWPALNPGKPDSPHCKECGQPSASATGNADTGITVYTCPDGHTWVTAPWDTP
jgi:hypothetical protein